MIALELGIAFVTGGLVGAVFMGLFAARGNDELHVENARLRVSNYRLEHAVRRAHDALRQARAAEVPR